jgi:hypothetical protein
MMTLVNGYVCRDCTDAELAKRGIDPAHPKKALEGSEANTPRDRDELGQNQPLSSGSVGTRLNVLG